MDCLLYCNSGTIVASNSTCLLLRNTDGLDPLSRAPNAANHELGKEQIGSIVGISNQTERFSQYA